MIRFFMAHAGALRVVFLASILLNLTHYAVWHRVDSELMNLVGALLLFGGFPWSWYLVPALEPVFEITPHYLGDAFIHTVFAFGFAINATVVIGAIWCRRSTGRWWPSSKK